MNNFEKEIRKFNQNQKELIEKSITTPIEDYIEKCNNIRKGGNKTEFSTKERENLAKKKEAMPDGSFPIRNSQDLKDAIKSVGRAKDYDKAKAWIIKRAKELKQTDLLPEDWGVGDSIEKAKYIKRTGTPDNYHYEYPDDNKGGGKKVEDEMLKHKKDKVDKYKKELNEAILKYKIGAPTRKIYEKRYKDALDSYNNSLNNRKDVSDDKKGKSSKPKYKEFTEEKEFVDEDTGEKIKIKRKFIQLEKDPKVYKKEKEVVNKLKQDYKNYANKWSDYNNKIIDKRNEFLDIKNEFNDLKNQKKQLEIDQEKVLSGLNDTEQYKEAQKFGDKFNKIDIELNSLKNKRDKINKLIDLMEETSIKLETKMDEKEDLYMKAEKQLRDKYSPKAID